MKITFKKDNGKKYLCSVCDNQFSWNGQSFWYGSYKDLENKNIDCVCSSKCKSKYESNLSK